MELWPTQPLTEMNIKNISGGTGDEGRRGKGGRWASLRNLSLSYAHCLEIWVVQLIETL